MPAFATDKLSNKERAIVPIAAFTASGDVEKLKISLSDGLESGLTINEIKEVLAQLYAYAAFPRSLNGLAAFMEVVEVRKNRGITDILGRESTPFSTDKSSLELGSQNQTTLFDFSPQIDQYLKAHLFGDIFARDLLTWKQREIATIAALANINGVNRQLAAHYNISMNNGVSAEELNDFILVLKQCCDESIASNAQSVLDSVLDAKN
ncbi:carboxymuconolactone decarboxylase family protein [Vibrio parahaemolyticus]|nr:carboxymuconolactone decarboxylase family protein [Vibrio parahaemolyticus]